MKVLVLGNGAHVNKRVLPALNKIKTIESIIVADKNTENNVIIDSCIELRNFEKELKSLEVFDFIIIATPPYNHKTSLLEVLEKSDNILIEKPIFDDLDFIFGEELKKLKNDKNIFESLMYLHHPLWLYVKDLIKQKDIKKVTSEFSVPHMSEESYRYKKDLGGGSLFDQGIYPISMALEISDNSQIVNKIEVYKSKDYEVDLGGTLDLIIDENINYVGKWGLGKDYKNYLRLESPNGEIFQIDFIFSKPDDTYTKVKIKDSKKSSEVNIGKYDQFQIMYQDLIDNNFLKFEYSNHENLIKRYNLMREVLKEMN